MGKLPGQSEYTQKETCQAISLRSGKEVEGSTSKKKIIVVDEDEVGIKEVEVSGTKDDKGAMKSTKDDATMPPKENEPKVDFKNLPHAGISLIASTNGMVMVSSLR